MANGGSKILHIHSDIPFLMHANGEILLEPKPNSTDTYGIQLGQKHARVVRQTECVISAEKKLKECLYEQKSWLDKWLLVNSHKDTIIQALHCYSSALMKKQRELEQEYNFYAIPYNKKKYEARAECIRQRSSCSQAYSHLLCGVLKEEPRK